MAKGVDVLMKREIKFRAWNILTKKLTNLNDVLCSVPYYELFCHTPDSRDLLTIDQFTGLKDKYGVEIYERDITKVHGDILPVEFLDGCFWAGMTELYKWKQCHIEVIGNIHKNKDLLK